MGATMSDLLPHIRVNCDREGCTAFVDVGHRVSVENLNEALIVLEWSVVETNGGRDYHWCGPCASEHEETHTMVARARLGR
jgi:hypothetical protein